jgi:4-hydroxybenzoate polyprenyltransferase/phosphoserine phosphatase
VDLDGTLIKTDILYESIIKLVTTNPLYVFALLFWLLRGKAELKEEVAKRIKLDASLLPYRAALMEYLRKEQRGGRKLVLATASNERTARTVNEHLQIFDEVLASDATRNLGAHRKRDRLVSLYGERGFDYAGNGHADIPVWRAARNKIIVEPRKHVCSRLGDAEGLSYVREERSSTTRILIKALRPYQWAKNILVFVPLFAAHEITVIPKLIDAIMLFLAFNLCASGAYVLNDLIDIETDRHHARKRHRPFASGNLHVGYGLALAPCLLLGAGLVAAQISAAGLAMLGLYFGLTMIYSLFLKKLVLLDVMALAGLYTVRVLAGVVAVNQVLSFWLLAFSVFLFASLALVKRHTELVALRSSGGGQLAGRGYHADDIEMLVPLGVAAGYMAVLVFALYINSNAVRVLYNDPYWLWAVCPLLLYWISRVWILSHRGEMHDDPIVFALTDKISLATAGLVGIFIILAT